MKAKEKKKIRGYKAHYDDNGKVIGYTKTDIWGSTKFYDTELNLLDEVSRNFIQWKKKDY